MLLFHNMNNGIHMHVIEYKSKLDLSLWLKWSQIHNVEGSD
jgi:hypothetical protein